MAYTVEQRTNEIGLRMALGADRGHVIAMVLRGAFWQIGIGLGLGIPLAILAGKLMKDQLYGVRPWDPVMLAGATILACAGCAGGLGGAGAPRCRSGAGWVALRTAVVGSMTPAGTEHLLEKSRDLVVRIAPV